MVVPVRFDFGGDRWAIVKVPVDRAERVHELPAPLPVTEVEFNAGDAVLCEAKREKF
jgi:hypothetical protein